MTMLSVRNLRLEIARASDGKMLTEEQFKGRYVLSQYLRNIDWRILKMHSER